MVALNHCNFKKNKPEMPRCPYHIPTFSLVIILLITTNNHKWVKMGHICTNGVKQKHVTIVLRRIHKRQFMITILKIKIHKNH